MAKETALADAAKRLETMAKIIRNNGEPHNIAELEATIIELAAEILWKYERA